MRRLAVAFALSLAAIAVHPLAAQGPTVRQIAVSRHVLVLLSDGTVSAVGNNRSGQLGRPKGAAEFLPPGRVALPGRAVQVAADDDEASYALLEDGTVWAWGRGVRNNLGVALEGATERETPAPVPGLADVARVVASRAAVFAVLRDGTVRAWGDVPPQFTGGERVNPGVTTPVAIDGLSGVVDVAGAPWSGYALTRDGHVMAWGANQKGELGTGSAADDFHTPTRIPALNEVVSIATVSGAAAAVTRDGRVWTWGANGQAGLGHGTRANVGDPGQPAPAVLAGISDAAEVKAGTDGRHFIVRRRNGTLVGWGNTDWGQLGAGVAGTFQPTPTPIALPNVDDYWLGGNFTFIRTKDGTMWFCGGASAAVSVFGIRSPRVPTRLPATALVP